MAKKKVDLKGLPIHKALALGYTKEQWAAANGKKGTGK